MHGAHLHFSAKPGLGTVLGLLLIRLFTPAHRL